MKRFVKGQAVYTRPSLATIEVREREYYARDKDTCDVHLLGSGIFMCVHDRLVFASRLAALEDLRDSLLEAVAQIEAELGRVES